MPWVSVGSAQILAVHAALLNTDRIVLFSGDEHDRDLHLAGDINHTRLFDCAALTISTAPSPASDLFCCGHAFLGDGRLLVAGGTENWGGGDAHGAHGAAGHFSGLRDANIFNPATNAWTRVADMIPEPGMTTGGGRWYPTLLTLPDGRVLAMSGHPKDDDTRHTNTALEAFTASPAPSGNWAQVGVDDPTYGTMYYPRLFVLPGGDVLCASPVAGRTMRVNPVTGVWTDVAAAVPNPAGANIYGDIAGTAVLLPLLPIDGYRARVLVCNDEQPYVLDTGMAVPTWNATAPRALAGTPRRRNGCAIILPTGEIFSTGGAPNPSSDAGGLVASELYTPGIDAWSVLETPSFVRNYHSVALLMPDGRVWVAGSNIDCKQSFDPPGVDNRQLTMEIYEPWYYGRPDRPVITTAPGSVAYNTAFDVETPQAASVSRVALLRCGSSTHAFNPDQRYVGCTFTRGTNKLTVTSPPGGDVAPPGYYLLYLIGPNGVPSLGRFIRIPRGRKAFKEHKFEIKELKIERKELKREIKEFKELKEIQPDKPVKEWKDKDKDLVEDPLFPGPVDIYSMLGQITQRVQELERQIKEKGRPFIQPDERPDVGGHGGGHGMAHGAAGSRGDSRPGPRRRTRGKGPTAQQGEAAADGGPVGDVEEGDDARQQGGEDAPRPERDKKGGAGAGGGRKQARRKRKGGGGRR